MRRGSDRRDRVTRPRLRNPNPGPHPVLVEFEELVTVLPALMQAFGMRLEDLNSMVPPELRALLELGDELSGDDEGEPDPGVSPPASFDDQGGRNLGDPLGSMPDDLRDLRGQGENRQNRNRDEEN